jgi:hypothetical protein
VQDIDFDLSQFGLFLDNDTLFLTVHINSSVKTVGRKIISGDVLELPHLKDPYNLKDVSYALKRFYVVEDVSRASEGFTPTWYPHLYRLKLKQIVDSQEYREILDLPADEDTPGGDTLRDMLSTFEREMQVNDSVIEQAEADAPKSGYDVGHYYTVKTDTTERESTVEVQEINGEITSAPPPRAGYRGYMLGDNGAPNGEQFGHGIQFPDSPERGDYFLRTDFMPKRLFQYDGSKWLKVHDVDRMTMTNSKDRRTQKTKYINNDTFTYADLAARDFVDLEAGDTEFATEIPADTEALYLVLKRETLELDYVIADHPLLLESDSTRFSVNLPVVDGVQQEIPYSGAWEVKLYNHREQERQSLSRALRPRSD